MNSRRWLLLLLLGLALWPLAVGVAPAMQDYPQHLFQAQLLYADRWPALDYSACYEAELLPGPYAAFFWAVGLFSLAVQLTTAGRLVLALYPVLLVAWAWSRREGWGAALVVALAFGPMWFLGFTNYLLSLPLLLFALRAWADLAEGVGGRTGVAVFLASTLGLFFTHPVSLLIFVALTALTALLSLSRPGLLLAQGERLGGLLALAVALPAVGWLLWGQGEAAASAAMVGQAPRWLPFSATARFGAQLFVGVGAGVSWVQALCVVGALVAILWASIGRPRTPALRRRLLWLGLCAVGFLVLPYSHQHYSYVNLRLVALVGLLAAAAAARVGLGRGPRAVVALCSVALVLQSSMLRAAVSGEKNDVIDIIEQIPPNQRVLPLSFDHESPRLHPGFYDPHLHDHLYYHLRVGGGCSPYLFESAVNPARFKAGARPPAPGEYQPGRLVPAEVAPAYGWFVTRGAPAAVDQVLLAGADKVAVRGAWALYRLR